MSEELYALEFRSKLNGFGTVPIQGAGVPQNTTCQAVITKSLNAVFPFHHIILSHNSKKSVERVEIEVLPELKRWCNCQALVKSMALRMTIVSITHTRVIVYPLAYFSPVEGA